MDLLKHCLNKKLQKKSGNIMKNLRALTDSLLPEVTDLLYSVIN